MSLLLFVLDAMEIILLDVYVYVRSLLKVLQMTLILYLNTRLPHGREEWKKKLYAPYRRLDIQGLDEDQQLESFFTLHCILERTKILYYIERGTAVQLNGEAYNCNINKLDGSKGRLMDYQKLGRPLVLNFGSCSWAPYMAEMSRFNELASEYAECADFLSVYINEMHASDSWKYEGNINIPTHRSLDDRIRAANILLNRGLKTELVCDAMSDECSKGYAAMPERLYVVLNNKVVFIGGRGPHDYSVDSVRQFLQTYTLTH